MAKELLSLPETTRQLDQLFQEIEANEGELTPELEERLDRLTENREIKALRIIRYHEESEAVAKHFKEIAALYTQKARTRERTAARLHELLLGEMRGLGEAFIRTPHGTVVRTKIGRPRIELRPDIDLEELEEKYKAQKFIRVPPPPQPALDKNKVYQYLKMSNLIPDEPGHFAVEAFHVEVRERLRFV